MIAHVDCGYPDQLTSAVQASTGTPATVLKRYAYTYDPAGNRTSEQIDNAVMGASYNTVNELVSQQPAGALVVAGTLDEPAAVTVAGQPAVVTPGNQFRGPRRSLRGATRSP
jgi:hypothetical protein